MIKNAQYDEITCRSNGCRSMVFHTLYNYTVYSTKRVHSDFNYDLNPKTRI